jgi:hypothetical protein
MSQAVPFSYSAVVEMWLDCGEYGLVPLARIAPKSVVAKEPRTVPAGIAATLVVTVDGRMMSIPVMLTNGFTPSRLAARVMPIDDSVPF